MTGRHHRAWTANRIAPGANSWRWTAAAVGLLLPFFALLTTGQAREAITGTWTLDQSRHEDRLQLTLIRSREKEGQSTNGFQVPVTALQGLTREQLGSPGTNVQFRLVRDAGTFAFDGQLKSGRG